VIISLTVNLERKIGKKIFLLKLQEILHPQNISDELLYLTWNVVGNFIIWGASIIICLLILFQVFVMQSNVQASDEHQCFSFESL
jgi:hypothetical protein